ncbi:unnamed protein product [Coregonus sp. 'balchen']|nr:unnamed protein product [Coregonus sp. 'balchen']
MRNVTADSWIRVDGIPPPSQSALLYETVTVDEGKPILRDMVFSPDYQYIYMLSDKQVSRLPVESCSQDTTCKTCLGSGDPHCGWCSRQEACEKWTESQHFNTELDHCVDISVTPNNMSVTSTSTQLSVKVVNVPSLSAGVTCVFEELTESPGEVLAKGQVLCMSPSLRDVPSLTQGYGDKRVLKLSLKSKETGHKFITTDFIYYNCSVLQSCTSCVSNPFPCNWCKYRHICTNNLAECSFQEGRVSSVERQPAAERAGPTRHSLPQPAPACPSLPQPPPACPSLPQPAPASPSLPQPAPVSPSMPQPPPACPSLPQSPPACPSLPQPPPAWSNLLASQFHD